MKNKRIILYRLAAVLLLIIIGAIMMVIGRGHTIYFDSKSIEYNGQTYTTPYKTVINVGKEQVAKLYDNERGMTTCIGQKLKMTIKITEVKGGEEKTVNATLSIQYNMDGLIINLPAYLAGLPEEVYLTPFTPTPSAEELDDSEPSTEEGIPTESPNLGE